MWYLGFIPGVLLWFGLHLDDCRGTIVLLILVTLSMILLLKILVDVIVIEFEVTVR